MLLKTRFKKIVEFKLIFQPGPYRSIWFRIRSDVSLDDDHFSLVLDNLIANCPAALYLMIAQEKALLVAQVLAKQFKFHHFDGPSESLVYYRWLNTQIADRVPGWATAIEGSMTLPLSADRTRVLLVHEYGQWKGPGGAVDAGEHALTTAKRELFEETNLKLNDDEPILYLGGLSQARARDNFVNDRFAVFAAVVANENELKLDQQEILKARWFSLEFLLDLEQQLTKQRQSKLSTNNTLKIDGEQYSALTLRCLRNFSDGKTFNCVVCKHAEYQYERVYFI